MAWMVCFSAAAQYSYQFTDLGALLNLPLGGLSSSRAVNDSGQIVVNYTTPFAQGSYFYTGGIMTDLTLSSGLPTSSEVMEMNNAGRFVGYYASNAGVLRSFVGTSNGYQELSDLGLSGSSTMAFAINDAGQIAGVENGINSSLNPFYFDGLTFSSLPHNSAVPLGINSQGQIVGTFMPSGGVFNSVESRAFTYSNGSFTNLGALPGAFRESSATAINDAGLIVGYSTNVNGSNRAVTFQSGGLQDLGTLGGATSYASDLNNAGDIVGSSVDSSGVTRAALWSNNNLYDLNDLAQGLNGYRLESAVDISNTGLIVGQAFNGTNYTAYLLTPIAPVPEPAGVLLLVCGGVMFLMTRKRPC